MKLKEAVNYMLDIASRYGLEEEVLESFSEYLGQSKELDYGPNYQSWAEAALFEWDLPYE